MKGCLSALMFLLVVLAVCTARAQEPGQTIPLGDVVKMNPPQEKADPRFVISDQKEPAPATNVKPTPPSLCGPPIPLIQQMYALALAGQQPPAEDQVAKELLNWLGQHPDLEKMDPVELARKDEPRTDEQEQADKDLASKIAQSFTEELVEYKKSHTDEEVKARLEKLISGAEAPQRQGDVLASAVRDEQQRRAAPQASTPSDKDRLDEAVNLYAICENKRMMASQDEVEKLTRAAMKEKLEAAGFSVAAGE
jgi:hypothetical protein